MLWPRTVSPVSTALPDLARANEDLRRAVLQASWARDRRVGRRRLAMRWVQWALLRYVVPALLVLGAAALVWSWLLPEIPALLVQAKPRSEPTRPTAARPEPVKEPTVRDTVRPEPQPAAPPVGVVVQDSDTLMLQLESRWGKPRTPGPKADPIEAQSLPTLKPENWLHSKEP